MPPIGSWPSTLIITFGHAASAEAPGLRNPSRTGKLTSLFSILNAGFGYRIFMNSQTNLTLFSPITPSFVTRNTGAGRLAAVPTFTYEIETFGNIDGIASAKLSTLSAKGSKNSGRLHHLFVGFELWSVCLDRTRLSAVNLVLCSVGPRVLRIFVSTGGRPVFPPLEKIPRVMPQLFSLKLSELCVWIPGPAIRAVPE